MTARSTVGKELRRKVISGAVMVFVTAGYSGKRFIFEKAKQLGVRSVVIDGPDSWCKLLEAEGEKRCVAASGTITMMYYHHSVRKQL